MKVVHLLGKRVPCGSWINLEEVLEEKYPQFLQKFLAIFLADSYGCRSQGSCLQLFMQRQNPSEVKMMLWQPIDQLWHLLVPDEKFSSYTFLPLSTFLYPPEDSSCVLEQYFKCLTTNKCLLHSFDMLRGSFVYWFLVHHVACSFWPIRNDPKSLLSSRQVGFLAFLKGTAHVGMVMDVFLYQAKGSCSSLTEEDWINLNIETTSNANPTAERILFLQEVVTKFHLSTTQISSLPCLFKFLNI
eukprot:TRINITY_DN3322_c0_g2_i2.p1 TRINITY_DN3322_c0_g2~~TRINITY_DN3322_c0_g2_i2.p1  ORF type:complete len:243 (+),score=52.91 TRINITY_DN3322_c0_g2_i2:465-1193(+)